MQEALTLVNSQYKIIRQIGQGGFGKTYLAENTAEPSSPRCVIKEFIPQDIHDSEESLRLFISESNRLKEVGIHPQIPSFLDFFEQDDKFFLVQEYIEGQNLEEELRQNGAFSPEAIKQILSELLPVLTYIHDHQLIHRDIKPENIVRRRTDGHLFLVDFGAAKAVSETVLAKTGTMIGSAGYVSPEQSYGKTVYASDVYSLGVTCVHLLTNLPPFELIDYGDWGWDWQDSLPNTTTINPDFTLILDRMIERGLNKRFKMANEVEATLAKLTQSVSLPAPLNAFITIPKPSFKFRWKRAIAILVGVYVMVSIGRLAIKVHSSQAKEAIHHLSTYISTLAELKEREEQAERTSPNR